MQVCPNLSDPNLKLKWDALVSDPEIGTFEAMREFLDAEKQNRDIGTPESVKAKLNTYFTPKSEEAQKARINEQANIISEKINDPTFTDPDVSMGLASLINPVNTKSLTNASHDINRATEIVKKLSRQLDITFEIISPEQAALITANAKNPWKSSKNPAFMYGDTVYFLEGALNTTLALHEYAHPLVRSIANTNEKLFTKLYNQALQADPALLQQAISEYSDLQDAVNSETDPEAKNKLEVGLKKIVAEEVVVKAFTKVAVDKVNGVKTSPELIKVVKDFLYAIKKALRALFGQKINISKLNESTTLEELAEMLATGDNFQIDTNTISQEDIVAYNKNTSELVNDLREVVENKGAEEMNRLSRMAFDIASKQIKSVVKNKHFKEMLEILADEYNRGDLQEIRGNLSKYSQQLTDKVLTLEQAFDRTNNEAEALINSMLRLEKMMEKIDDHLNLLKQTPNDQDSLHKAFYYSNFIEYWGKYIEDALDVMGEGGSTNTALMGLLSSIEKKIQQSGKSINYMYSRGISEVLTNTLASTGASMQELFDNQIERFKSSKASQRIIDKHYIKFHGLNEADYNEFKRLEALNKQGSLGYEDKKKLRVLETDSLKGARISKEKIDRLLKGEIKDANFFNSFLEGYLYNTDPIIGGFAVYFNDNMVDMEAKVQAKYNEITSAIKPFVDNAGISFVKPGAHGEKMGFVDKIKVVDKDPKSDTYGQLVEKEVWTLLNRFKDYRADIDQFDDWIKRSQEKLLVENTEENKKELSKLVQEKARHMREHFYQEYVDSFYEKDKIFDKFEGETVGAEAKMRRDAIFDEMRKLSYPVSTELGMLEITNEMDVLWRQYRLLFSSYNLDGTKKEGLELEISERLQEYRNKSRDFYEFKERKGVFQSALLNVEREIFNKIVSEKDGPKPGTPEFTIELDSRRQKWINANTRVAISPEFYQERARILTDINSIMDKLPEATREALDFGETWKEILDATSGFRDDDGQPIGSDISEGRKAVIKELQEKMIAARKLWDTRSGITQEQRDRIRYLNARLKNPNLSFSKEEKIELDSLNKLLTDNSLSTEDRELLDDLYEELSELQSKDPTQYYLDTMNAWLEKLDLGPLMDKGANEVTVDNAADFLSAETLSVLFDQGEEGKKFQEWYMNNHIMKEYYDDGQIKFKYERIFVWNVTKPNDPSYYETTEIKDEFGRVVEEIQGLPSLKYYARVVKKEYKTGYNKDTDEVRPIVGLHVDNRGEFLPKEKADGKYRNERYYELQQNDPEMFKLLEKLTEEYLKIQEGAPKRSRLYMDFPRFEKSNLEVIQTSTVEGTKEKMSAISLVFKNIRDWFRWNKADAAEGYNHKAEYELVRTDMFDDELSNIPVPGLYGLDAEQTSTNFIYSMMRYMQGLEKQKKLIEINPVAKALQSVLNKEGIKEENKIEAQDALYKNVFRFVNKKDKYVRLEAFNSFYSREFEGQTHVGAGKDNPWMNKIIKYMFGRASFSFFALNAPSALKNMFGAKFQAMIEAAGGKYITPTTLIQGEAWSTKYMFEMSFGGQLYTDGPKSEMQQIAELFDPSRGRFQEKFAESITRTIGEDTASMSWLYNFRKWTELQATMQMWSAMMYKQKVKTKDGQDVNYIDAWHLVDGKIQLKDNIMPEWGITYDAEGVMQVGDKFKEFKRISQQVITRLNGAYSQFDQPEAQRYLLFKMLSYLRRYFTTMAINRFGKHRFNPGINSMDEGYYITGLKSFTNLVASRNFHDLTIQDRKAWMKIVTEVGALYILGGLIGTIFGGFDPDDEEKYAKLREKSGALPLPFFTSKDNPEFNITGFLELHSILLLMNIRAENEQFIPFPKYGLDNLTSILDMKSIAAGPTIDTYKQIATDLVEISEGGNRPYYQRKAGPYKWQDKGGMKIWAHLAKTFGITGSSIDPAKAIKNLQTAKALSRNR